MTDKPLNEFQRAAIAAQILADYCYRDSECWKVVINLTIELKYGEDLLDRLKVRDGEEVVPASAKLKVEVVSGYHIHRFTATEAWAIADNLTNGG